MYEPIGGLALGNIYQDAGRSTAEQTTPTVATSPAATIAHNSGAQLAGVLGIQFPALIALGVLAVVLVRYYD